MFTHIFKYRLLKLIRTKEMIFWTLAFPLILAFFFNLAFSNLDASEGFSPIDVALVTNEAHLENDFFKDVIKEVSSGEDRMFNLRETTLDEAQRLLDVGTIRGYMIDGNPITLHVKESGLAQNIMRLFLDRVNQTTAAITEVMENTPESMARVMATLTDPREYTSLVESKTAPPSQILNYFYTLIAMACMYGAFFGSEEVTDIQANISDRAARINLAPVHKMTAFVASSMASYLVLLVNMAILLVFLRFGLGIDFGDRISLVILTVMVGSLTGLTFGAFISALIKKGENLKVAVIVGVSMAGSFLAGMMYSQMKYIIKTNLPILSYLNPVNLITDAFYSLYYYDTLNRYFLNMGILLIMIGVFSLGTFLVLRRQKYASI